MLSRNRSSRAYDNPTDLIRHLESPAHKLAAKIQLQSGARVNDILRIQSQQLNGVHPDPVTGEKKGKIWIEKSKGGKCGEIQVITATYIRLAQITYNGGYSINIKEYRADLKQAARKSIQLYHGTHGLRWSFAQNRFREVQEKGKVSYKKALSIVSSEMFHKRENITKHYLS